MSSSNYNYDSSNELKITINTSIPGYQKIEFKPSMVVSDSNVEDNRVYFDPLIKISENTINYIPDDMRKTSFFNKGLFDSLLNNNKNTQKNNLSNAKNNGYIDNNIKITIDTIFPEGSIITINKNPYLITDLQWTKGSWKIKTNVDEKSNKIDNELNEIYGQNYVGARIQKKEVKQVSILPTTQSINSEETTESKHKSKIDETQVTSKSSSSDKFNSIIPDTKSSNSFKSARDSTISSLSSDDSKSIRSSISSDISTPSLSSDESKSVRSSISSDISTPSLSSDDSKTIRSSISSDDSESLAPLPILKMTSNNRTNDKLKQYFDNRDYYSTINYIYKNITDSRSFIKNNLAISTDTLKDDDTSLNLNKDSYDVSVKMLDVIQNEGKGECLFLAIADALNYYNSKNKNKITYSDYGNKTPFTKDNLRELVFDYFLLKIREDKSSYIFIPTSDADELNLKFESSIQRMEKVTKITNDIYKDVLINIYKSNPNFLVDHINEMPDKTTYEKLYHNPFYVIDINNEEDIKKYILSDNYWGGTNTIDALNSKLKIKIIPFGRDHDKEPIKIYPTEEFDTWTHYLFLYYQNAHYELVTFDLKQPNEKISIFKREPILDAENYSKFISEIDKNSKFYILMPPLYILFIIFGSIYYGQTEEVKNNFKFFPNVMTLLSLSVDNILTKYDTSSDDVKDETCEFISNYKKLFPLTRFGGFDGCNAKKGGQNVYNIHNYYDGRYPYNKYRVKNYLNKYEHKKPFYVTYINIDLELHPGRTITPKEFENVKCMHKWNAIKKAYSEFTGKPYVIRPIYNSMKTSKNIKSGEKYNKHNTKKYNLQSKHHTKKYLHKSKIKNITRKK